MNVTEEPAQTVVPGLAPILTPTGRTGFTVIVMVFDVAGEPVAQVRLLVSTQVTASPLARVELVNVLLFDPTLEPLTFH